MTDGQPFSRMSHPIIPNELRPLFGGVMTESYTPEELATSLLLSASYRREDGLTPRQRKILADQRRMRDEYAAWREQELVDHQLLMETATGHRREILDMHGPVLSYDKLICTACGNDCCGGVCDSTRHPCSTYTLARDWEE